MDALRQDLIYAVRVLRKDRAYAAAVIVTLAVCLGANTAIFTVVRSVLLRPLSLNPRRAPMYLSLGFGGVALLLAAVGLYGLLAYHVSQRTREIGIRMALGSQPSGILRLVLGEGSLLVALGLAGGLAGALALRSAIAAQLYGVGPLHPAVMLAAGVILAATSFLACLGPARRAARISPIEALSHH